MGSSQSLLELVGAAQAKAKTSEVRISEILKKTDGQSPSNAQIKELGSAIRSLELGAVDTFSLFEARMQHHFRRGPFARKLKSLLLEAGQTDLADRFHQYYLANNVLKHGKGASYRELLNYPSSLVVVLPPENIDAEDGGAAPKGLVDVSVPGFFDGLVTTILEAYHFLENR